MTIKIFKYIEDLDCFVVDNEYKEIADKLGLTEWNEVVWIGRFFTLDNDYGEHWFDNWELRDKLADKAKQLNIDYDDLLIIDPKRFKDDKDGPCHTDIERVNFWTDVLISLRLSLNTLFSEARRVNEENRLHYNDEFLPDLENRIQEIKNAYN